MLAESCRGLDPDHGLCRRRAMDLRDHAPGQVKAAAAAVAAAAERGGPVAAGAA